MRILAFTDIHFGANNNSEDFNKKCVRFVEFAIQMFYEYNCDVMFFLGDWFNNRSLISTLTLHYSQQAIDTINENQIPYFHIVGNHDLSLRNTREIHTPSIFKHNKNITVVDTPMSIDDDIMLFPYLFREEYNNLNKYLNKEYWFGHFEFRGFVVTGQSNVLQTGPSHENFSEPKIFSGHFHKRQTKDNVTYIGNAFPIDFRDANDDQRGITIIDTKTSTVEFIKWNEQPLFYVVDYNEFIERVEQFGKTAKVRVMIPNALTTTEYSQLEKLRTKLIEQQVINDVVFLERKTLTTDEKVKQINSGKPIEQTVVELLESIEQEEIDKKLLVKLFKRCAQQ